MSPDRPTQNPSPFRFTYFLKRTERRQSNTDRALRTCVMLANASIQKTTTLQGLLSPLSAASPLMSSLRRVPRLDPRFRGDDTCWLGWSRCSSCFEASPNSKPPPPGGGALTIPRGFAFQCGQACRSQAGGNDSAACTLKNKLHSYMQLDDFGNM